MGPLQPMNTDSLAVLARMRPGSALFAREQLDQGPWEIAWLVREESARIAGLGPAPEIEFRAGVFEEGPVLLVPVLVRVGPQSKQAVYESWINQHAEGMGGTLETLADQPRLVVHLYGEGCGLVRTLTIGNQLATFAGQALAAIVGRPTWSMEAFDQAREQVYQQYPQVWDLWRALGKPES
jgi:hypothetical protein